MNITGEELRVSGKTGITALIGDPIDHVLAPLMANTVIDRRRLDLLMVAMHVNADDLPAAMTGLRAWRNFRGGIVTMPHKSAVVPLLDEVTVEVREAGACNVIRRTADGRLAGALLDGEGFIAGLTANGHSVKGKWVLLAGAGGAGRAIAFSLARHGAHRITIANRTASKAAQLAHAVHAAYTSCDCAVATDDDATVYELVVNATSLGMKPGDAFPFSISVLRPGVVVADIVISSDRTALIEAAERRGCQVHVGRHMLAAQIEAMLDFIME
jgi:shikimate dehydrogenase